MWQSDSVNQKWWRWEPLGRTDHIFKSVAWRQRVFSFSTLMTLLRDDVMLWYMQHTRLLTTDPCCSSMQLNTCLVYKWAHTSVHTAAVLYLFDLWPCVNRLWCDGISWWQYAGQGIKWIHGRCLNMQHNSAHWSNATCFSKQRAFSKFLPLWLLWLSWEEPPPAPATQIQTEYSRLHCIKHAW